MRAVLSLVPTINAIVFGTLAVAALRVHRGHRTAASRWLLATFGSLASVVLISRVFLADPTAPRTTPRLVLIELVILVLVAYPYFLHRFSAAFRTARRLEVRVATGAFVAISAWTLVLPPFPRQGEPRPSWIGAYTMVFLAYWTVLSVIVAVRLWRRGRRQPPVARVRMRLLAAAAATMTAAILVGQVTSGSTGPEALIVPVTSWVAAALFLLGFAPPVVVRRAWRADEEAALRQAEAHLMVATDASEAVRAVLEPVSAMVGGGAAFVDRNGGVIATGEMAPSEAARLAAEVDGTPDAVFRRDAIVVPIDAGAVVVRGSEYAPFFGTDDVDLLRSAASSLDLCLARLRGREELARSNEELSALVYGISHDLRNPIVTILGYIDLLTGSKALPPDEQARFLERIRVSARYMDSLIADLLELSRIGRSQTTVEAVDLAAVVSDVAGELGRNHPEMRFEINALPTVSMNPVRARQLFTNLLENAARHGGREDLTVTVTTYQTEEGGTAVEVRDDGVGIPEQYRERVFGIFERLHPATSGGTGIGLAMCRRILTEVGGRLTVGDAAPGAAFVLEFPPAAVAASSEAAVAATPQSPATAPAEATREEALQ